MFLPQRVEKMRSDLIRYQLLVQEHGTKGHRIRRKSFLFKADVERNVLPQIAGPFKHSNLEGWGEGYVSVDMFLIEMDNLLNSRESKVKRDRQLGVCEAIKYVIILFEYRMSLPEHTTATLY